MTLSAIGTFDNFNRYSLRGLSGIAYPKPFTIRFLPPRMMNGSSYPLIADHARYAADYSRVEISINPALVSMARPLPPAMWPLPFIVYDRGVPQFRLVYKGTLP